MTTPSVRYDRAPSEKLMELLMPGGFLEPLVGLNERTVTVAGSAVPLDVHFRVDDEVHVYCGRTTILTVRRLQRPDDYVSVKASNTYSKQPCAERLFRRWSIGEIGFGETIDAYLKDINVNPSFTEGEGAVQAQWSRITCPWVPFDREAVLESRSTEHPEETKKFPETEAAFDAIRDTARQGQWAEPPRPKSSGEIDQLAVDSDGRLVLIELKNASKRAAEVYYAPFQLLQYVWEWHNALEAGRDDLQKMIDARKTVGLTPNTHRITGGIRAAVGFGLDSRSDEVKRRYRKVLKVVNRHLPCDVSDIETWKHPDNGPRQIDPDPETCPGR